MHAQANKDTTDNAILEQVFLAILEIELRWIAGPDIPLSRYTIITASVYGVVYMQIPSVKDTCCFAISSTLLYYKSRKKLHYPTGENEFIDDDNETPRTALCTITGVKCNSVSYSSVDRRGF